jgi:hypothetical protein
METWVNEFRTQGLVTAAAAQKLLNDLEASDLDQFQKDLAAAGVTKTATSRLQALVDRAQANG